MTSVTSPTADLVASLLGELERDDSGITDDGYLSFKTKADAEFAIKGAPEIVAKRLEVLEEKVGPVPPSSGKQEGLVDVVLDRIPPEAVSRGSVHHAELQTGDLLLFVGTHQPSVQLRQLQWSPFSHVAVVLRHANGKPYCLQATTHAMLNDEGEPYLNEAASGVYAAELGASLDYWLHEKKYGSTVLVRRLSGLSNDIKSQLETIGFAIGGAGMDYPNKAHMAWQIMFGHVVQKALWFAGFRPVRNNNTFFCSQLVAQLFIDVGLLHKEDPWACLYTPEMFNRMHDRTFILQGVTIGEPLTVIGFENAFKHAIGQ